MELRLDPGNSAFLIVDMQHDFPESGGHFARQVLAVARRARDRADSRFQDAK